MDLWSLNFRFQVYDIDEKIGISDPQASYLSAEPVYTRDESQGEHLPDHHQSVESEIRENRILEQQAGCGHFHLYGVRLRHWIRWSDSPVFPVPHTRMLHVYQKYLYIIKWYFQQHEICLSQSFKELKNCF